MKREMVLAAMLASCCAVSALAAPNAILPALVDASVSPADPDALQVIPTQSIRAGPDEIFLKFALPRTAWVLSAILEGVTITGSGRFEVARLDDDDWTESAITWNTRPTASAVRVAVGEAAESTAFAVDLTSVVQATQLGDGILTLRIAALPGSGAIATFASRGAWFRRGFHLALELDPAPRIEAGDLLTMGDGSRVMAITPATHLHKLLGAQVRLEWPRHVALDPRDGAIVLHDPHDPGGLLIRIDPASGNPVRVPIPYAASSREASESGGMAIDSSGAIFVAAQDADGAVVRVAPDSGEVTVVGGHGWPQLAIEDDGSLIAGNDDGIVRIDTATGVETAVASGGLLGRIGHIGIGARALWVTLHGGTIVRVDRATGSQSSVPPCPIVVAETAELPDGRLLVASRGTTAWGYPGDTEVGAFDPVGGSYTKLLAKSNTGLGGLARAPDGSFVFLFNDWMRGPSLSRVDPVNGDELELATPLVSKSWRVRIGIEPDRRLLVLQDDRLVSFDPLTGSQRPLLRLPIGPQLLGRCDNSGADLFRDRDGRLLMSEPLDPPEVGTRIVEIGTEGRGAVLVETAIELEHVIVEDAAHFLGVECQSHEFSDKIWRIDRSTGIGEIVSADPFLIEDSNLLLDPAGRLFAGNRLLLQTLVEIDRNTGTVSVPDLTPRRWMSGVTRTLGRSASGLLYALGTDGILAIDLASNSIERIAAAADMGNDGMAIMQPRCADGWDNDGDGAIDYPADTDCASVEQDRETPWSCGVGAELPLILAAAAGLARRPRWRGVPSAGGGEE